MENVYIMERFKTFNYLDEDAPYIFFSEVGLFFLMFGNFLEEITIVCVFHYDTDKNPLHTFNSFELTIERKKAHQ